MDDLRVESYDAKEFVSKKQSISKRVAVAGGTVVLTLSLFGLTGCIEDTDEQIDRFDRHYFFHEQIERPDSPSNYVYLGGSGSWFVSSLERI